MEQRCREECASKRVCIAHNAHTPTPARTPVHMPAQSHARARFQLTPEKSFQSKAETSHSRGREPETLKTTACGPKLGLLSSSYKYRGEGWRPFGVRSCKSKGRMRLRSARVSNLALQFVTQFLATHSVPVYRGIRWGLLGSTDRHAVRGARDQHEGMAG